MLDLFIMEVSIWQTCLWNCLNFSCLVNYYVNNCEKMKIENDAFDALASLVILNQI